MSVEAAEVNSETTDTETPVDTAPANQATESQVDAGGMYDMTDPEFADPGDEPEGSETEEVAESESEVTGEPSAASTDFPDDLLAEAESYGFNADEAKELGEAALRRAMVAIDRREAAYVKARMEQQEQPEPAKAAETAPKAEVKPEQTAAEIKAEFEKLKLEIDPTQFDEDTLKLFNGINDHYDTLARKQHSTLSALQQRVEQAEALNKQITSRFAAEDAARVTEQFDTFLNGLGEEYQDTFGKGEIHALKPDSPEFKNRQALWQEMEVLKWADQIAQRRPASVSQLANRAMQVLHGDKLKTIARKEVVKQVEKQRSTAVERPTARKTRPQTAEQRAIALAKQWDKEHPVESDTFAEV